jgi:hypothetical protein
MLLAGGLEAHIALPVEPGVPVPGVHLQDRLEFSAATIDAAFHEGHGDSPPVLRQLGQYQGAGVLIGFGLLLWHLAHRKRLPLTAVFGRAFFPVLRMVLAIGASTRILVRTVELHEKPARLFRTGQVRSSLPESSGGGSRRQKQPVLRQHVLNRLPEPQEQRSFLPSFSAISLLPWTTRTPRFTCVSAGTSCGVCSSARKKRLVVEVLLVHDPPPFCVK